MNIFSCIINENIEEFTEYLDTEEVVCAEILKDVINTNSRKLFDAMFPFMNDRDFHYALYNAAKYNNSYALIQLVDSKNVVLEAINYAITRDNYLVVNKLLPHLPRSELPVSLIEQELSYIMCELLLQNGLRPSHNRVIESVSTKHGDDFVELYLKYDVIGLNDLITMLIFVRDINHRAVIDMFAEKFPDKLTEILRAAIVQIDDDYRLVELVRSGANLDAIAIDNIDCEHAVKKIRAELARNV